MKSYVVIHAVIHFFHRKYIQTASPLDIQSFTVAAVVNTPMLLHPVTY